MTDTPTTPAIVVGENCYISLDDANDVAAERLFATAWNAATDLARAQALLTATALLGRLRWQGRPLAATQPLAFPRVPDRCPSGYPLSVDVPAAIVTACAELAIDLLNSGELPGSPAIMQRMLGDSMVMYYAHVGDELPKHVRRLIEPFLASRSANVAEVSF